MAAAPSGQYHVHIGTGDSGTEANELAINAALNHYATQHGVADLSSLSVLGFDNSNHGTSTVTLSCSSEDANHQKHPTLNWPKASFPQLKYPFAQYEHENMAEEARCLDQVKDIVKNQRASGSQVGAIIVEPISSVANQMASPQFFKQLRVFAKNEGISFIVDETKTGLGSTGKYWGCEHWHLSEELTPDYVTFGGKSHLAGFYASESHKLNDEATSYQGEFNSDKLLKLVKYG